MDSQDEIGRMNPDWLRWVLGLVLTAVLSGGSSYIALKVELAEVQADLRATRREYEEHKQGRGHEPLRDDVTAIRESIRELQTEQGRQQERIQSLNTDLGRLQRR